MIIKAHGRSNGRHLAAYLLTESDQQKVAVLDLRGSLLDDLGSSLCMWEVEALATTKAEKPLYHMQIRLAPGEGLDQGQWFRTLDIVEQKLNLTDHPRAVVAHDLNGERHLHVVYSRLDRERMKLLNMGHDRKAHHATARQMEKEYGLRVLSSEPNRALNGNQKTRSMEHHMAKESGTTRQALCNMVRNAWNASNTGREFQIRLECHGMTMTPGDKRDYNLWHNGKRYDPVRLIENVRTLEFRAKMQIDPPVMTGTETILETRAGDNAVRHKANNLTHEQLNAGTIIGSGKLLPERTTNAPLIRRKATDLIAFGPADDHVARAQVAPKHGRPQAPQPRHFWHILQ